MIPSKQSAQPGVHVQSSVHWEDFLSLLSFRDVPEGPSAIAVHFQGVLVCHADTSENQAQVFPFSVNWL